MHLYWEPSNTRTHSSLPCIKMKINQKVGQQVLFMDPYFYLFILLLSVFLCQDEKKTGSSFVIIGCNLSNNHKLALYKAQSGEPTFFFNTLVGATCTKTWRHPNTIKLASWLVDVLCDFKATWHQEVSVSFEYLHHKNASC